MILKIIKIKIHPWIWWIIICFLIIKANYLVKTIVTSFLNNIKEDIKNLNKRNKKITSFRN